MARAELDQFGIGAPVRRKEDARLLVGEGQYTSDRAPPDVCWAAFVRSPHAHAKIVAIETTSARAAPGVLAVFTGADLVADGLRPIPHEPKWTGGADVTLRVLRDVFQTDHWAMPPAVVRHVGEAVAVVIAGTPDEAADAAALVNVDYEVLLAVVHAVEAMRDEAPQLWPGCADNTSLICEVGQKSETDAAFARAAHVVRLETWVQRVTGSPMEPRAAIGAYDVETRQYTLCAGSGGGMVREQETLAGMLGVNKDDVRAFCGDMGGNFGTRNTFFPEYGVLPWAARKLRRPVKWVADRTECFLTDYQGRDLHVVAELALDETGRFLAVRGENISNIGAYTAHFTPLRKGLAIMQGVYAIPSVHFRGLAVLTNTAPTTPYRSAGRPEAIYVIERLIDLAAEEHGFDRIELRRQNLIRPEQFPYTNAVDVTYDSGDYARSMDAAMTLAAWDGFPDRKREAQTRGRLRGIGLANYVEGAGGFPRERAEITIDAAGRVELVLGTMNSGQGHETSFAQLLVSWLGVPFHSIRYVAHDTARVKAGGGSHSGRSMRIGSLAIGEATDDLIAKAKTVAAHVLQADLGDVSFANGVFSAGSGGSIGILDLAAAAESQSLPGDLRGALHGVGDHTTRHNAYPSGCHICEVEIDPDTGKVDLVGWYGADDVGLAVNPMILHGQMHGAMAQGAGQALMESVVYDPQTGQALSASFMDYAMPRADDLPSIKGRLLEISATSHKFGIRPGGEGGTTPALGCVINAVVDALSDLGVRHVEMPATPERVWRAIRDAQRANPKPSPGGARRRDQRHTLERDVDA